MTTGYEIDAKDVVIPAMYCGKPTASYHKLPSGQWAIKVRGGDHKCFAGVVVPVTKRDGTVKKETIVTALRYDGEARVCTISAVTHLAERPVPVSRTSRGYCCRHCGCPADGPGDQCDNCEQSA